VLGPTPFKENTSFPSNCQIWAHHLQKIEQKMKKKFLLSSPSLCIESAKVVSKREIASSLLRALSSLHSRNFALAAEKIQLNKTCSVLIQIIFIFFLKSCSITSQARLVDLSK
jgi:hypothetical protein